MDCVVGQEKAASVRLVQVNGCDRNLFLWRDKSQTHLGRQQSTTEVKICVVGEIIACCFLFGKDTRPRQGAGRFERKNLIAFGLVKFHGRDTVFIIFRNKDLPLFGLVRSTVESRCWLISEINFSSDNLF